MITLVGGARPNFPKIAPVWRALTARGIPTRLVHTGQHFDPSMSWAIWDELELPPPDRRLAVGGQCEAAQIADVVRGVAEELMEHKPRAIVVVGDVTSTLGAALAASTLDVPIAHVEACLRSNDWTMPEERNRVIVDRLSRLLLTPTRATWSVEWEGLDPERVRFVGNTMIDSLFWMRSRLAYTSIERPGLVPYALVTMHRPSNVDDRLPEVLDAIRAIATRIRVLFPVHPRTRERLRACAPTLPGVHVLGPSRYRDFVRLMEDATLVATDSGGVQEETTALGVPCLTLRDNTERPLTVTEGTNKLVGLDIDRIGREVDAILARPPGRKRCTIEGWDGRAGERVADALAELL